MTYLGEPASRRKTVQPLPVITDVDRALYSPGGWVLFRRTRWSPPVCNAVAALAGIGPKAED